MKKVFLTILFGVVFLIGIGIGGKNNSSSKLFEESKSNFESEISTTNNNYNAESRKPQDGMLNKIAKKVDKLLESISKKIA